MSRKIILQVENVVSGYIDEIDIIRGTSFNVYESEILSIIGPNGAGKSTMLKTIFGILKTKSGSIIFNGKNITKMNYIERLKMGISFVPQGRCNFPMMTVKENLEMGAFIRDDNNVQRDIEKIMDRFPILKEKKNELAGNLSGGQQQILEMGIALTLNPKILLVDEPTLGLAPKIVSKIFEEILNIREMGCTIIMVEQNARKALSISDHAVVLELGKKRFEGTGNEIANSEEVKKLYLGG
ncbi:ABC transporter ATP-binding protein [Thermococci archaeon]|nr:MAG: ABC transporter ATP-binding protein [Thermococci archaeon]